MLIYPTSSVDISVVCTAAITADNYTSAKTDFCRYGNTQN